MRAALCIVVALGCGPKRASDKAQPDNTLPGFGPALESEPDGEDDGGRVEPGPRLTALAKARRGALVALPAPPDTSHPVVCDLLGFKGGLYASHAVRVISDPGARIHRYDIERKSWSLAFDFDRPGSPGTWADGGGEGITRLRDVGGVIMAADADAPGPGGYGYVKDAQYEDYLFVSDSAGRFPPLEPGELPPKNSVVLPLAFHAFDVIRYGGALIATGGTGRLPRGPYPGALYVGELHDRALIPRYTLGRNVGVVRTTYMHRFKGRLYVGFQNNSRKARFDLAIATGDLRSRDTPEPVVAKVTEDGGWLTRRFETGLGALWWVAAGYENDGRGSALFRSEDGQRFERVPLPETVGEPQDVLVVGSQIYLLASGGVFRAGAKATFEKFADAPAGDPFGHWDTFCSAPLVGFGDRIYAGSLRDGRVYALE